MSRRDPPSGITHCIDKTGKRTQLLHNLVEFLFASAGEQQNRWRDSEETDISFLKKNPSNKTKPTNPAHCVIQAFPYYAATFSSIYKARKSGWISAATENSCINPALFLGAKLFYPGKPLQIPRPGKRFSGEVRHVAGLATETLIQAYLLNHDQFLEREMKRSSSQHRRVASTDPRCSPPHLDVRR